MRYEFKMPPKEMASLPAYLSREFAAVSQALNMPSERLSCAPAGAAPAKPRDGDIVYADGVAWNPGAGAGHYSRTAGTWVKMT